MTEADAVVCEDAAAVRAAMRELVEPALDGGAVRRAVELDDAAEPAHQCGPLPREGIRRRSGADGDAPRVRVAARSAR